MGNSPQIGLRDLYYALITNTEGVGVAPIYAAPVQISEAINAKISPKVQSEILWADDNASEVLYNLGEVTVELEAKDLSIAMQAALGGHTISGGVVTKKSTDIPPYLAIGFRAKKANGIIDTIGFTKESLIGLIMKMNLCLIKQRLKHQN